MRLIESLQLALGAIWAHKLRSALTLLGLIIGVMSVVVIVSIIQGFNVYVDEKIAGIGAKTFRVYRFNYLEDFKDSDAMMAAERRNKNITIDDFDYLRARAMLVASVGAKAFPTNSQVKHGSQILDDVPVAGAMASIAGIENTEIGDGRFFSDSENETAKRVAYIGSDVAGKLFASGAAVGSELMINGLPYRVIGVSAFKGTVFGLGQDTFVNIPLKTYAKDFGPLIRERSLYIVGISISDALFQDTVEEVRQLMRDRRRLPGVRKRQLRHHHSGCNYGFTGPHLRSSLYRSDCRSFDSAGRRRDRDHEYHARLCHGAHARDWPSQGYGCAPD